MRRSLLLPGVAAVSFASSFERRHQHTNGIKALLIIVASVIAIAATKRDQRKTAAIALVFVFFFTFAVLSGFDIAMK